jgi:hypothetical protein
LQEISRRKPPTLTTSPFDNGQNLPIDNEPVVAKDLHCCRWIESEVSFRRAAFTAF